MNNKKIILKCMEVNNKYMRLPAGNVAGLHSMITLYKRIAGQSLQCARAWVEDSPCPKHEPATDALVWGVVAWADALGLSIGVDQTEWGRVFVSPHDEFASYLRPNGLSEPLPTVVGPPADIIISLDALWIERVIKLTTKWSFLIYLPEKSALTEARRLVDGLRIIKSPIYKAYLESDLTFFRRLFENFPFSDGLRKQLDDFITRAEEVL